MKEFKITRYAPSNFLSHEISVKSGDAPRQNRTTRLCGASGRFRPPEAGCGVSPEILRKFRKRDKKFESLRELF